jgi:phosphoenolpyruvate carboxykinase (GTP)
VLKWVVERVEGRAAARDTPVGHVPTADQLDLDGLDVPRADVEAALAVDVGEWRAEIPSIEAWFDRIGPSLPTSLRDELAALALRLGPA